MGTNPTIATILASPELRAVPIGASTLGAVLPEQIHIGIVGDGPMSGRQLEAQTPAAEQALRGASGQRLERMLRGVMAELDGHEGASQLTGFSLATTTTGFAADMLVNHVALGHPLVTKLSPDWHDGAMGDPVDLNHVTPETLDELRGAAQVTNDRFAPMFTGQTQGTMVLGPQVSQLLLRLAHDPRDTSNVQDPTYGPWNTRDLVHDVLHEAQHAISPFHYNRPYNEWLEEGTADVLSTWPGAVEAGARRMGISLTDQPGHEDNRFYPVWATSLRAMLGMAGVDTADPNARGRVADLLQGESVDHVGARLTDAIVRANDLPHSAHRTVARLVNAGDADKLANLIAAARSGKPTRPCAAPAPGHR